MSDWRDDVPGSFSPGFEPPPLIARAVPDETRAWAKANDLRNLMCWSLGECQVIQFTEPSSNGFRAQRFTVSHGSRLPNWDELKLARYRLLPANRTFALLMPPPEEYVDDPRNPYCMEIREVLDHT